MAKITGFGGFFFKTNDTQATAKWFTEKLDLPTEKWGRMFMAPEGSEAGSEADKKSYTVMGLHGKDSDYFGKKSTQPFMLNLRVDDLEAMLTKVREQGVEVIKVFDPDAHGRFAHIEGPDGITIELWEEK